MPIFNDLIYARQIPQYVPMPMQPIKDFAATLQDRYDLGKDAADKLLAQVGTIGVRDINQPIVDNILNKANDRLSAVAEQGDYENAAPDIMKLAREIDTDPLLRGAMADKKAADEYEAQRQAGLKDGTSAGRWNDAGAYSSAMNNKPVEIDPVTGQVKNVFQGFTPGKTPDIGKQVGELISKVKDDNTPLQVGKTKDGKPIYMTKDPMSNAFFITGQTKGVSEAEAAQIITGYMMTDPQISNYYREGYKLDNFKQRYDQETGQYRPLTAEDFGGEEIFKKAAEAAGMDPATLLGDQKKLELLHQQYYLQKEVGAAASPFISALEHQDTEFKYMADPEHMARLNNSLELQKALALVAANEDADKRKMDHKAAIDAETERRQQTMVTMGAIPTEPALNYQEAQKSIAEVDKELTMLQEKEKAAGRPGSGVTFTPAEQAQKIQLQNEKRVLEVERKNYMQTAALTTEGLQAIDDQWRAYVASVGGEANTEIDKNRFYDLAKAGQFDKPKTVQTTVQVAGGPAFHEGSRPEKRTVNDPKDFRTYLKNAEQKLSYDGAVQKATHEKSKATDYEGFFGLFTGDADGGDKGFSTNDKTQYADQFSKALTANVFANGGVGFSVPGSKKELSDVLSDLDIKSIDNDEGTMDGKDVTFQVVPMNQKGDYNTIQYHFIVKDKKTKKEVTRMNIVPQNQSHHSDLLQDFASEISASYDENTEVGKAARNMQAHLSMPWFNLKNDLTIVDSEVHSKTPEGVFSVGTIAQVPGAGNYALVKTNAQMPTRFEGSVPVTVKQPTYTYVRLKDDVPPDQVIDSKSITKYLYNPAVGLEGNALANPKRMNGAGEMEKGFAAKNPIYDRSFPSAEDAHTEFFKVLQTKQ